MTDERCRDPVLSLAPNNICAASVGRDMGLNETRLESSVVVNEDQYLTMRFVESTIARGYRAWWLMIYNPHLFAYAGKKGLS